MRRRMALLWAIEDFYKDGLWAAAKIGLPTPRICGGSLDDDIFT